MHTKILFLLIFVFTVSESYNILVFFPFPFNSHFMLYERLFENLASKGHNLTVVGYFPKNSPIDNYRDVNLRSRRLATKELLAFKRFQNLRRFRWLDQMVLIQEYFEVSCRTVHENEIFQTFLKEENDFDLILMQYFMSECYMGLMQKYDAPYIGKR